METIDLKKNLAPLYQPKIGIVTELHVPALNYLMIDGEGDPNTSKSYAEAIEALFSVSYALKFAVKKGSMAIEYGVMPLESLWTSGDMLSFIDGRKELWQWTAMILQPEFITAEMVNEQMEKTFKKKKLPGISRIRFEELFEGDCVQIMHVGPFSEEGPIIQRLHDHIASIGELRGKHHEIYLSDFRKTDPAKLRTILRQALTRKV